MSDNEEYSDSTQDTGLYVKTVSKDYSSRTFVPHENDDAIVFDYKAQVNQKASNAGDAVVEVFGMSKPKEMGQACYGIYCGPESINNRTGMVPVSIDLESCPSRVSILQGKEVFTWYFVSQDQEVTHQLLIPAS
jgi:hypothetical protein